MPRRKAHIWWCRPCRRPTAAVGHLRDMDKSKARIYDDLIPATGTTGTRVNTATSSSASWARGQDVAQHDIMPDAWDACWPPTSTYEIVWNNAGTMLAWHLQTVDGDRIRRVD